MLDHPRLNSDTDFTTLVTWHDGGFHFFEPLPDGNDGVTLLTLYYATYILIGILGFAMAILWQKRGSFRVSKRQIFDSVLMATVGGAFGARIGEVLFYHPDFFLSNPRLIVEHTSGYSVHGAILGAAIALSFWSRWAKKPVLHILDQAGILVALGTLLGRLTNFYLAELPGKPADPDLPWAMHFPIDDLPRHPVMLYQAITEGLLLMIVLIIVRCRAKYAGTLTASTLVGYGLSRTVMEFFREPDAGIAYPFLGLTVGQLLSLSMALIGGLIFWQIRRKPVEIMSIEVDSSKSGVRSPESSEG